METPTPITETPSSPPTKKRWGCGKIGCVAIVVAVGLFILWGLGYGIYLGATGQLPSPAPVVETEPPAATPTPSRAELEHEFLSGVDESITGARIAGNMYKFVGDKVDLHGKVLNVIDDSTFNFETGDIETGDMAVIVVQTDSGKASQLEGNRQLRVIGTVVKPFLGKNNFGATVSFPSVQAAFLQ